MISLVRDCYKTVSERYMLDVNEDLIDSVNKHVNERLADPENGAITFSGDDIVTIWKEEWDNSTKRLFKLWWNSTKTDMMYPEEVAYEYLLSLIHI